MRGEGRGVRGETGRLGSRESSTDVNRCAEPEDEERARPVQLFLESPRRPPYPMMEVEEGEEDSP